MPLGMPAAFVSGWVSLGFAQEMVPTCASDEGAKCMGRPAHGLPLCMASALRSE